MPDGYWVSLHEEREHKLIRWAYVAYDGTDNPRYKYDLIQEGNKFSLSAYPINENAGERKPYMSRNQVKKLLSDLNLTPFPWDVQDMSCVRNAV